MLDSGEPIRLMERWITLALIQAEGLTNLDSNVKIAWLGGGVHGI